MRQSKREVARKKAVGDEKPALTSKAKKAYSAPALEQYGDLESLTKGHGPGSGDGAGGASTKNPCWIAEVLYGVDDSRTLLLRTWLTRVYSRTAMGSVVVALYRACGERLARSARRSSLLRRILAKPFDAGVIAALRHYTLLAR